VKIPRKTVATDPHLAKRVTKTDKEPPKKAHRWIQSLNYLSSSSATQFHLLPEGEGRDEGEGNYINPPICESNRDRSQIFQKRKQSRLTRLRFASTRQAPPAASKRFRTRAMTRIEVVLVVVVLGILVALLAVLAPKARTQARLLYCNNNMKQVELAMRVWEGDHTNSYPMAVSESDGGTREFITGLNAYRHFQVMSNELATPLVLICPAESDRFRKVATNFVSFYNSNLSYFVGVEANEANPQMILSGDHNLTNSTPPRNGMLLLSTNDPTGWSAGVHGSHGNICLSDGSVEIPGTSGLQMAVANTALATNHLQMPVITP
jgi:hypothetical protein